MIAGHFGFAAMVKARERTTALWALMFATVWLDIVFIPLLLAHLESVQQVRADPSYGGAIIHADYSHSFVVMIILSTALGFAFLPRWGERVATVIGLVAASQCIWISFSTDRIFRCCPGILGIFRSWGLGCGHTLNLPPCLNCFLFWLVHCSTGERHFLCHGKGDKTTNVLLTQQASSPSSALIVLYMDYTA